jgi:hypothetical protein
MSHNPDVIVQELHVEFESMLNYVRDSRTATADQVERGLFRRLLSLGARLMLWFFALRTAAAPRGEYQLADGATLPYRTEHRRQYFSIFGKLAFWRPYFYHQDAGGASPLDQELALGSDCYSDLVRELVEYLGVGSAYAKVADCLARIVGLELSTQAISDLVAEDAGDVEAFYAQQAPPASASEAEILVVQADGKGVPIVRTTAAEPKVRLGKGDKHSRKKEAVVTGLYTIALHPRTPAEVLAVNPEEKRLSVDFEGNVVSYEAFELEALTLAYAITIHKSQGSEFPAVVVPVLNSHHIMLQRNLLYTAITRARKLVVLVGDPQAIAVAVRNDKVRRRYTALAMRLGQPAKALSWCFGRSRLKRTFQALHADDERRNYVRRRHE